MGRIDRRQRLALDEAYKLYRQVIRGEKKPDLYQLAHCLTTLGGALNSIESHQFKLTARLWQRIYASLCDLLITSFPVYIVVYKQNHELQTPFEPIIEPAVVEIHPEALKRKTDIFCLKLNELNPMTKSRLEKLWLTSGPKFKPEDFQNMECGEFCAPKNFLLGDDVLSNESEQGRQLAYKKWWELYWQAYCSHSSFERRAVQDQMYSLEEIWGNLYY